MLIYLIQQSELERLIRAREAETKYVGEQNEVEITKAQDTANIETEKQQFYKLLDVIPSML